MKLATSSGNDAKYQVIKVVETLGGSNMSFTLSLSLFNAFANYKDKSLL